MGRFGEGETMVRTHRLRMLLTWAAAPLRAGNAALRRTIAMHGRRLAVLWRSFAGPGRRVRLPRRSIG